MLRDDKEKKLAIAHSTKKQLNLAVKKAKILNVNQKGRKNSLVLDYDLFFLVKL